MTRKIKIIDSILLFNELDLLEIRINELNSVIDRFIVIQSNTTFSGKQKKIFSLDDVKNISKYRDKIFFYNVEDMPKGDDPWAREKHQRNSVAKALNLIDSKPNDKVIVADIDEIPRPESVLKAATLSMPVLFQLRFFYYYVNVRGVTTPWWPNLRMASVSDLLPHPQQIRDWPLAKFTILEDAGWHFSFIGGKERIREKVAAFSHHREFNNEKFVSDKNLDKTLLEKKDLFDRRLPLLRNRFSKLGPRIQWEKVYVDNSYPKYLLENLNKFNYMVAE